MESRVQGGGAQPYHGREERGVLSLLGALAGRGWPWLPCRAKEVVGYGTERTFLGPQTVQKDAALVVSLRLHPRYAVNATGTAHVCGDRDTKWRESTPAEDSSEGLLVLPTSCKPRLFLEPAASGTLRTVSKP